MSRFVVAMVLAVIVHSANAQVKVSPYRAVDSIALQIPDSITRSTAGIARYISRHFRSEDDKVRAAFIWVASTFNYDVAGMYTFRGKETQDEKITRVLTTHKGVCDHYSAVFTDICRKLGLRAYTIMGYTKQRGEMSTLAHAWCTVYTAHTWKLYDPTWASGFISKGTFTPRINNEFYDVPAEKIIASHMPYDPMWQMLNNPYNSAEFAQGQHDADRMAHYFNYSDSIVAYERQSEEQQLIATARRIEANGVDNELTFNKLNHIRNDLDYRKNMDVFKKSTANVNLYNDAVADYNAGVKYFNSFVEFRNKDFKPAMAHKQAKAMIDSAGNRITAAQRKLKIVTPTGNITEEFIASFSKNVNGLASRLDEQKAFLADYLDKSAGERRSASAN
jgi:hypothetical protein